MWMSTYEIARLRTTSIRNECHLIESKLESPQYADARHTIPYSGWEQMVGFRWAATSRGFFVTRRVPGGTELVYMDMQGHIASIHNCPGISCVATVFARRAPCRHNREKEIDEYLDDG